MVCTISMVAIGSESAAVQSDCTEWRTTGWGYTDEGHNAIYQERTCSVWDHGDEHFVVLTRVIYY